MAINTKIRGEDTNSLLLANNTIVSIVLLENCKFENLRKEMKIQQYLDRRLT